MSVCLNHGCEGWSGPRVQIHKRRVRRFPTLPWTSVFSSVKWRHEANGLRRTLSPLRVFSNCAVSPHIAGNPGGQPDQRARLSVGARGRGVSAQAGVADPARNEPGPPGRRLPSLGTAWPPQDPGNAVPASAPRAG